jgi:hypothetical protein
MRPAPFTRKEENLIIDHPSPSRQFHSMSLLELKQAACQLSKRDRQELHAYLIRLKHNTPEWKRATAKRLNAMQAGKRFTAEELVARIARG